MSEYKDRYCGIITILKTLPFPQASTTKQGESTYQIVHCKGVYRLTIDWNNGIIKVDHQTFGTVDYWSKFSPLLELFKTKEEREALPTFLNMLVDLLPERNYEVSTPEQLFNYIYAHDVDLHMNMVRAQFNAPILYAFIKWYSDEYGYPYELMKKMVERHLKYREKFGDIISFYQDEVRAAYVMRVHSHHVLNAYQSSTDYESLNSGTLEVVLGKVNEDVNEVVYWLTRHSDISAKNYVHQTKLNLKA